MIGRRVGGYFDYWGKARPNDASRPFHLLAFHSLDVAAVGTALLGRDARLLPRIALVAGLEPDGLREFIPFLLGLHDLGKFAEPFQDQRPELVERLQGARAPRGSGGVYHDTFGYQLWRSWWKGSSGEPVRSLLPVVHASNACEPAEVTDAMAPWFAAVLGHHGRPPADVYMPAGAFAPSARSRSDAAAFAQEFRKLLRPCDLTCTASDVEELEDRLRRSSWWLAGFAILCDWIGSGADHFAYEPEERPLADYWDTALASAERAVHASGVVAAAPRSFGGLGSLFPRIASSPSPLQRAAEQVGLETGPRLLVLEDLTGSGKTEAALVLAHRLVAAGRGEGIFFALPTMATANAMADRVRPLLPELFEGDDAQFVLAHSGPRLEGADRIALGLGSEGSYGADEEAPASASASAWISDNRKKALLADVGVGTIDQALLAVLQSKHAALRLFGLQRRILVVDEVHACDAYMQAILGKLLEAHAALGGSAILLSATLPGAQRAALAAAFARGLDAKLRGWSPSAAYPLLTSFGSGGISEMPVEPRADSARRVSLSWVGAPDEAIASIIRDARLGRCVCWIRNSVADALEAYDAVVAALGIDRVTLFHARFALEDRLRIEGDVVGRFGRGRAEEGRRGRVVIATQVVEQSLDIDFDSMVTDVCPVDLVIQRAGRLHRHHERPRPFGPTLQILAPAWAEAPDAGWLAGPFRRTAKVYPDPGVLWRTVRVLQAKGAFDLPRDARTLVEEVYGGDEVPVALRKRSDAATGAELAHASVAQSATIRFGLGYQRFGQDWSDEVHTPTRLGEPTTTVRLARLDAERAGPWAESVRESLRWPLSQVSVARRLMSAPHPDDAAVVSALEETQPFVGDDVCTLVLREGDGGFWWGRAVAERSRGDRKMPVSVRARYSRVRGLEITEGA